MPSCVCCIDLGLVGPAGLVCRRCLRRSGVQLDLLPVTAPLFYCLLKRENHSLTEKQHPLRDHSGRHRDPCGQGGVAHLQGALGDWVARRPCKSIRTERPDHYKYIVANTFS